MNQNTRRQQQFSNTVRILPRPQLTIGFAFAPAPSPQIQSNLGNTFQQSQSLPLAGERLAGVNAAVGAGGAVHLTGTVTDTRTRQLAEMLVRLEPGVRTVTNELVVTPPAP